MISTLKALPLGLRHELVVRRRCVPPRGSRPPSSRSRRAAAAPIPCSVSPRRKLKIVGLKPSWNFRTRMPNPLGGEKVPQPPCTNTSTPSTKTNARRVCSMLQIKKPQTFNSTPRAISSAYSRAHSSTARTAASVVTLLAAGLTRPVTAGSPVEWTRIRSGLPETARPPLLAAFNTTGSVFNFERLIREAKTRKRWRRLERRNRAGRCEPDPAAQ